MTRIAELKNAFARRVFMRPQPVPQGAAHPGAAQAVEGRQPAAQRPAPASGCLPWSRHRTPQLTLASLEAWWAAPGQSPEEQADRATFVRMTRACCPGRGVLRFRSDLDLSNLKHLTTLPEGLQVKGKLTLSGCTALKALPAGLQVEGRLNGSRCPALVSVPQDLHVAGQLDLSYCPALVSLPRGLHTRGAIKLTGCTALTSLPPGLRVAGYLDLAECTALTSLPGGLHVAGYLNLANCKALIALPAGLRVCRNLYLAGCSALKTISADLRLDKVNSGVTCAGCTALEELPPALGQVTQLHLSNCTALTKLPRGMRIAQTFDVSGCTALRELPGDMRVRGNLLASHCTALTQVPADVTVGPLTRRIDFSGCTALTSLPSGFRAPGNLILRGCSALGSLPEKFKIGGDLDLSQCGALANLPGHLSVGGNLLLTGCAAITQLPASFLRWRRLFDRGRHFIEVTDSGIPPEVVEALRKVRRNGVCLHTWQTARLESWDQALDMHADLRANPTHLNPMDTSADMRAFLNWQPDVDSIRALSDVRRRFTAHTPDDTDIFLRSMLCLHGPAAPWQEASGGAKHAPCPTATSQLEQVAAGLRGHRGVVNLVLRQGQSHAAHGASLLFHTETTQTPGSLLKFAAGQVSGCIAAAWKHDQAQGEGLNLPTCKKVVQALRAEHGCLDARVRAVADCFAELGIAEDVPVDVVNAADVRGEDPIADGSEHLRVFLDKQLKAFVQAHGNLTQSNIEADPRFIANYFNADTFTQYLFTQQAFPRHNPAQLHALVKEVAQLVGVFEA